MVCRHPPGYHEGDYNSGEITRLQNEIARLTPSPKDYEILDVVHVDRHLIVKAKYPSCNKNCDKVMVFLNTTPLDALKWKAIDPHFGSRDKSPNAAPSPAARFPATDTGWKDAIAYCKMKK